MPQASQTPQRCGRERGAGAATRRCGREARAAVGAKMTAGRLFFRRARKQNVGIISSAALSKLRPKRHARSHPFFFAYHRPVVARPLEPWANLHLVGVGAALLGTCSLCAD